MYIGCYVLLYSYNVLVCVSLCQFADPVWVRTSVHGPTEIPPFSDGLPTTVPIWRIRSRTADGWYGPCYNEKTIMNKLTYFGGRDRMSLYPAFHQV